VKDKVVRTVLTIAKKYTTMAFVALGRYPSRLDQTQRMVDGYRG
jgi:hypothetical protein